ncbi:DUF4177 domain-containing protein [Bacillus massiliigorillae]|uniref:DUF4177 domain-containing protein n=1 Tax=Bacillus massiliigorillae TaxID=1243664 RepID=UPI0003A5A0EA|nr:DUF4177 domain-containing protein [Bacillus massiliigorillae]
MKIYKYNVSKIKGSVDAQSSLEELTKHLNHYGQKGYKLSSTIPQLVDGSTESTLLVFEAEDHTEECTIG